MAAGNLTIPSRKEVCAAHKARGGIVAATLPIIYPRELLRAFDILPVEVWGPPGIDTTPADRWLQAYTCGIIRGALAFLEKGGLDQADMLLVPHACDSLQGLGSVLLDFPVSSKPVATIYLPRSPGEAAVDFLEGELRALARKLEEFTGRSPSHQRLLDAIRREEAADGLLMRLLNERPTISLTDREFYRLVRAREYLPAEDFEALAAPFLEAKSENPPVGVRILLSGIVPEPMDLFDILAGAGAKVVADDLAACGRRLLPEGRAEDPFRRMAERLALAPPCSTRGASIDERLTHIRRLADRTGASGVVFLGVKFCEPELFYLPGLRSGLEAAGLRSLVLELDPTASLPDQAVTRLEAFVESLEAGREGGARCSAASVPPAAGENREAGGS